jgi:hypothetical protein
MGFKSAFKGLNSTSFGKPILENLSDFLHGVIFLSIVKFLRYGKLVSLQLQALLYM